MTSSVLCVRSCRYRHAEYGDIRITVNGTARHIVARRVGAELRITVPPHLPVADYERFLSDKRDWILAHKPQPAYSVGQIIDCDEVDFSIVEAWEPDRGDVFLTMVEKTPRRHKYMNYYIHLSPAASAHIAESEVQEMINRVLIAGAKNAAVRYVIPQARDIAARIGHRPLGWIVKDYKTKLGTCSSKGIITLSPRLIFLPSDLREFVICHELAHLSEMNHSGAFHEICNAYCNGREAELVARLKAFRFPVI